MPREQGESGEFVETLAPEDVLDVFDAVDGPVVLSADVAEYFDVTRETARRKLQQLYDRGALDRRKVSRRVIYWRADASGFDTGGLQGEPKTTLDESGHEDGATSTRADADPHTGEDTTDAHAGVTADENLRESVRGALAGSDDLLERRVDAVLQMYAHLREHGTAEKDDLLDAVDADATGYVDRSSVWANMVKGKDTLRVLPGVRTPSTGRTTWRYVPEDDGET